MLTASGLPVMASLRPCAMAFASAGGGGVDERVWPTREAEGGNVRPSSVLKASLAPDEAVLVFFAAVLAAVLAAGAASGLAAGAAAGAGGASAASSGAAQRARTANAARIRDIELPPKCAKS